MPVAGMHDVLSEPERGHFDRCVAKVAAPIKAGGKWNSCDEYIGRDTCTFGRTSWSSAAGISRKNRDGVPYMSMPWMRRVSA